MAKKYDDFDEADQDGIFDQIFGIISKRRREFAIVSVSAAVLLLGLIVWDSYHSGGGEGQGAESVPIVRADATDYKTTPENPGGMDIPYRDSTVFSAANGQKAEAGTENILADDTTEEPVAKSKAFAGLNTDGDQPGGAPASSEETADASPTIADAPQGEVEDTQASIAKAEPVEPPSNDKLVKEAIGFPSDGVSEETPVTTTKTASATIPAEAMKATTKTASEPAPVKTETIEKAEATKAAKTQPAAGTVSAKGVGTGGYYVQLASVKSTAGAAGEYKKLQAKFSSLSGVSYRTQEANLGAKGTFYRIQAGPMSKESAAKICNSIKSGGGSCLVASK